MGNEGAEFKSEDGDVRGPLRQRVRGADEQLVRCYDLFFKPIADLLQPEASEMDLLIVPDRELYMLPFAGLRNSETGLYLIETCTIRFTPSLAALIALRARQSRASSRPSTGAAGHSALVVAVQHFPHPVEGEKLATLDGAVAEAHSIKDACEKSGLSVDMLLRESATKEAVVDHLPAPNAIVHFCTHGNLAKQALVLHAEPGQSEPVAALLSAEEVQRLCLSAKLGVLSACNTGRGTVTADGVAGLCRSFLAAGLDSVVATLCKVGDAATCEFMKHFYHVYLGGGHVHVAMQTAMCSMLRRRDAGRRVFYPADWAPFVCFGAMGLEGRPV
eukprot:Skav201638  [mRNA]  locus=scaffold3087:58511:59503:+ [translate_table: standard]